MANPVCISGAINPWGRLSEIYSCDINHKPYLRRDFQFSR